MTNIRSLLHIRIRNRALIESLIYQASNDWKCSYKINQNLSVLSEIINDQILEVWRFLGTIRRGRKIDRKILLNLNALHYPVISDVWCCIDFELI